MCSGGNAGLHVAMSGFLTPRPGLNELCDAFLFTIYNCDLETLFCKSAGNLINFCHLLQNHRVAGPRDWINCVAGLHKPGASASAPHACSEPIDYMTETCVALGRLPL